MGRGFTQVVMGGGNVNELLKHMYTVFSKKLIIKA